MYLYSKKSFAVLLLLYIATSAGSLVYSRKSCGDEGENGGPDAACVDSNGNCDCDNPPSCHEKGAYSTCYCHVPGDTVHCDSQCCT
jgi:hypothetical protein